MARPRLRRLSLVAAIVSVALCANAGATPPKGFSLRTVVTGLEEPTAFAYGPNGQIYIAEKAGVVRVFDRGHLAEFLDLRDQVNHVSDRGLLNIALDPGFAHNRRMYLFYTQELRPDDPDKDHPAGGKLISLRVSAKDLERPEAGSRVVVLSGFDSKGPWHSVSGLAFDSRGRLLAGFGDGSPYYPKVYGPSALRTYDLDVLGGKIVRIDPANGHGVSDNPFYEPRKPDAIRSKVLALGFRNPFSLRVDPDTGEVFVGDVGTDQWEEIDLVPTRWSTPRSELNFGWPCYEGGNGKPVRQEAYVADSQCNSSYYSREAAGDKTTAAPTYAYSGKGGAAIIVGPIYRGNAYPRKYVGRLFFADFVRDQFWTFDDGHVSNFGRPTGWGNPDDIQLSPAGSLAYLAFKTGQLNEIVYVGGGGPAGTSAFVWIAVGLGGAAALAAALWLGLRRLRRAA